jgi:hypothetical protein
MMAPSVLLRPEYRPTALDARADDIPALREKIFALLYENLDGMTAAQLNLELKESTGLVSLLLTDAYLEGELVRVVRPVRAGVYIADFGYEDHAYRLSPQKWVEMESND